MASSYILTGMVYTAPVLMDRFPYLFRTIFLWLLEPEIKPEKMVVRRDDPSLLGFGLFSKVYVSFREGLSPQRVESFGKKQ